MRTLSMLILCLLVTVPVQAEVVSLTDWSWSASATGIHSVSFSGPDLGGMFTNDSGVTIGMTALPDAMMTLHDSIFGGGMGGATVAGTFYGAPTGASFTVSGTYTVPLLTAPTWTEVTVDFPVTLTGSVGGLAVTALGMGELTLQQGPNAYLIERLTAHSSPVPEPSTWLLLASGLLALAARRPIRIGHESLRGPEALPVWPIAPRVAITQRRGA